MQIKSTMRYNYITIRMSKIKTIAVTSNAGKGIEKLDHSTLL